MRCVRLICCPRGKQQLGSISSLSQILTPGTIICHFINFCYRTGFIENDLVRNEHQLTCTNYMFSLDKINNARVCVKKNIKSYFVKEQWIVCYQDWEKINHLLESKTSAKTRKFGQKSDISGLRKDLKIQNVVIINYFDHILIW